jgi:UDP-4-amino-4-deoxy-L-arabinose-oxoglutarate aminotransferase
MQSENMRFSSIPHSKPWIDTNDREAIFRVLSSGMIAQGDITISFEQMVANYFSVNDGVATGSGTAALTLALLGIDVSPSDEVIIPTYTCDSVLDAVKSIGAIPILADIGDNWVMTPETVASKVTKKTAAIIAVHTFGIAVDMDRMVSIGPPVIEDCCQAFGAFAGQYALGTTGTAAVFSFHATKCLTTGEGGMVVSDDLELMQKMHTIRNGGIRSKIRLASPMTDLQAAMGINQLKRYDTFLDRRKKFANRYLSELNNCKVVLPTNIERCSIFFRFPIRINEDFYVTQAKFGKHGISVRRGVDTLLHRQLNQKSSNFQSAERTFKETLSLPIYPALTAEEQRRIIEICKKIWNSNEC